MTNSWQATRSASRSWRGDSPRLRDELAQRPRRHRSRRAARRERRDGVRRHRDLPPLLPVALPGQSPRPRRPQALSRAPDRAAGGCNVPGAFRRGPGVCRFLQWCDDTGGAQHRVRATPSRRSRRF